MFATTKKLFVSFFLSILLFSCTYTEDENSELKDSTSGNLNELSTLTAEQETALDAFTTLQVGTDERNLIYSTFANIDQPFYPPDTSVVIAQSEFRIAMTHFVNKNCTKKTGEERAQLVNAVVLAQEKYNVLHCNVFSADVNYENGLPMMGVWVIPNVLGQRDVVIEW